MKFTDKTYKNFKIVCFFIILIIFITEFAIYIRYKNNKKKLNNEVFVKPSFISGDFFEQNPSENNDLKTRSNIYKTFMNPQTDILEHKNFSSPTAENDSNFTDSKIHSSDDFLEHKFFKISDLKPNYTIDEIDLESSTDILGHNPTKNSTTEGNTHVETSEKNVKTPQKHPNITYLSFEKTFDENVYIVDGKEEIRPKKISYYKPKSIELPKLEIDKEKSRLLEDFLNPSYSKKDYHFKKGQSEKKIREYIKNLILPEEIEGEVINLDFKYRLQPKSKKGYFVTKNTWADMLEKTQDPFLKMIIGMINTVEFHKIPEECEEKEMLNYILRDINCRELYLCNTFSKGGYFLDLSKVVFSESDLNFHFVRKKELNIYEKILCYNLKFVLCLERINTIEKYFQDYGFIIPEELIDILTGKIIKNPILFTHDDDMFFDRTTYQNIMESYGSKLHPVKRIEIEHYKDLDIEKKAIYDRRIKEQEKKIKVFLDKLDQRLRKFYVENDLEKVQEYGLENL